MNAKITLKDPDILGSMPAMRRAAARAREVARATGTPLIIMRNGKITELDVSGRTTSRRKTSLKKRG
jgi:hypothetical protein